MSYNQEHSEEALSAWERYSSKLHHESVEDAKEMGDDPNMTRGVYWMEQARYETLPHLWMAGYVAGKGWDEGDV